MTRAERRRIAKKQNKKEPIYNISEQNINKIKQNVTENAVETAITLLFSLTIRVMKEHYGWGHKRLPELADLLCDAYQEFDESGRTIRQEAEYTYQMTGVRFARNLD